MKPVLLCRSFTPLLFALAGALPAQNDRIIGLERGDAVDPVKLDKINTSCTRLSNCSLAGILSVHGGNLGGTAYDSNKAREWSSGGRKIVVTKLDCALSCEFPIPATMPSITGMAFNRFAKHLYTSHLDGCTRVWDADIVLSPCPASLTLLGGCNNTFLHAGEVITGIEYDSKSFPGQYPAGRLFQVTTLNRLCVIHPPVAGPVCASSCSEICSTNLPVCTSPPFGPAQGLTYDKNNRHLWVTDGPNLMQISEAGAGCVLVLLRCCAVNSVDSNLSGLGWQPVPTPRPLGGVCIDTLRCPSGCGPIIGFEGAAAFNNPEFSVTLASLPAGGLSIFVLGFGGATPGVPVECGLLYTPFLLANPLFLAASHQGTQACGATASRNLGFFPIQAVDMEFTIQALSFCLGSAGPGVALSQAAEFRIGW